MGRRTLERDEDANVVVSNPGLKERFGYDAIDEGGFINNAVEGLVPLAGDGSPAGNRQRFGGSSHSHGMLLPRHLGSRKFKSGAVRMGWKHCGAGQKYWDGFDGGVVIGCGGGIVEAEGEPLGHGVDGKGFAGSICHGDG